MTRPPTGADKRLGERWHLGQRELDRDLVEPPGETQERDKRAGTGVERARVRAQASAPLPKFVIHCGTLWYELRKQRGTSKNMILVPLFDLKFLNELAAIAVGNFKSRH